MLRSLKLIHCADLHLDAPFKEHGRGTYAEIRRKDIRSAFLNILQRVKDEKAELLLIAGDLYEHHTFARRTMDWLHMKLSEVQVPVVIIPGNHDPYLSNSWYRNWDWPSNVTILSKEHPSLILEKEKVNLYGIGFASFKEDKPDLSAVPSTLEGYFNILMIHGTLDMDFTKQAYKPVTSSELEALGYDYYALGHFHTTRRDFILKKAFNPGSPEPLGFDEPGVHGAFLVTLQQEQQGVHVEVRHFETAMRVYHDKTMDITDCRTLEEVKIRLLGALEGMNPEKDITRITLKGRTELEIDPDILTELLAEDWLYLKIQDDTQRAFDMEVLVKDPTLKGAFVREMQQQLQAIDSILEEDPENETLIMEKEKLSLALQYGLEALQNGKIEWWRELY